MVGVASGGVVGVLVHLDLGLLLSGVNGLAEDVIDGVGRLVAGGEVLRADVLEHRVLGSQGLDEEWQHVYGSLEGPVLPLPQVKEGADVGSGKGLDFRGRRRGEPGWANVFCCFWH